MASVKRLYCTICKAETKHTGKGVHHLVHFALALLTLGAWLFVWAVAVLLAPGNMHCDACGERVSLAAQRDRR